MKIWIENPFDNLPIEGFRAQRYWLMAEAFRKAGHEVTLWTSDFNHTTKRKRVVVKGKGEDEGFSIRFVPTIPYHKNVSIKRIISHLFYAARWRRMGAEALAETSEPDVIILSSPPIMTGLAALHFKKLCGAKVVLDIMDLWPETFERVASKWILWPIKKITDFIRKRADLVTSVAEAYPGKTFYHGIELCATEEERADSESLRVVYIGNLGVTYDLKTVVEAIKRIKGATVKIAGQGAGAKDLGDEYVGYLGKEELERLLAHSDIGVIPMAPESCVGVPYKFADYAKAGLAIVSSLSGESSKLMKRYGAGEEYVPHDVDSLVKAIERLRPRLKEARASSRKMAEEVLDSKKIYADYVKYVAEMV